MNYYSAKPTTEIYLDSNATTCVLPVAAKAASDVMQKMFGNPSSSHITGLRARYLMETTRHLLGDYMGGDAGRFIFTSGATEAIQTAVLSVLTRVNEQRHQLELDGHVAGRGLLLYGATEHKAVPEALKHWNKLLGIDADLLSIPVDNEGRHDLEFIREHGSRALMICTMAVNNETGVVSDLAGLESTIRQVNPTVPWMVDSVQAVAKIALKLSETTIDYAPMSGHKLYAPKGIGMLYVKNSAAFTPLIAGGGQERGERCGTENLPGIAALSAVLEELTHGKLGSFRSHSMMQSFRDRLYNSLIKVFPKLALNASFEYSVPTTINFSVAGLSSKEILDLFDAAGIRVSSGSACSSAVVGSFVLDAMGVNKWQSESAIRLSFGPAITEAEVVEACRRIEQAGKALGHSCIAQSRELDRHSIAKMKGLVQLKSGGRSTWLYIDDKSQQCVVISPLASLRQRLGVMLSCGDRHLVGVYSCMLETSSVATREGLLSALGGRVSSEAVNTDSMGWPLAENNYVSLAGGVELPVTKIGEDYALAMLELEGQRVFGIGRWDSAKGVQPNSLEYLFCESIERLEESGIEVLRNFFRPLLSEATLLCPADDSEESFRFLQLVGTNEKVAQLDSSVDVHPDKLAAFFQSHSGALIVDVREPHEFALFSDWSQLGIEQPVNVPLTKLAEFIQYYRAGITKNAGSECIFFCRSGSRSKKAAEVMRKLGLADAWHIEGGIALSGMPREENEDEAYMAAMPSI